MGAFNCPLPKSFSQVLYPSLFYFILFFILNYTNLKKMFLNKQYLFSFGFCFLMLSTTNASCKCMAGDIVIKYATSCCLGRRDLHEVQKYKISNAIAQFKAKVSAKSNAKTKN